ncbi:hypothetical protein [Maribacter sp. MAR_2009_72]|uniref:hypothetical protein n=1 Tax=Maribacter sp. MAR_2009_72 TaxID=1250050 RepID=UPI00119B8F96|nr:hypothetical protein [Maribacter sp. MAR_2009_72]TVZ16096.1 hypothetical protein JM81_2349 [Maribacter sp. MAR_2009_72]
MKQQYIEEAAKNKRIRVKYSWVMQFLLVLDQFGNVLAGGNSDVTISGRVGYNVHIEKTRGLFWKKMESVINFTFYPLDGPNHCLLAYCSDRHEEYRGAKMFFKIILAVLIVLFCILLIIPIRLIALIKAARTHYIMPSGENIPYKDLMITTEYAASQGDPCEILSGLTK